ncbi:MAG: carotene hydroxylase [Crocinitomicaceae bacterium]
MLTAIAVIVAFFGMEFMAWFTHKFIMHGLLWKLHEDHHQPTPGPFEKNDLFFLIYAIPSWLCIMLGVMNEAWPAVGVGAGIALYGLVYFLVHDVLIHRRFKWFDNTNNKYFKAIRKAHKVHHKNRFKEEGTCFGMLVVPKKYFEEQS